MALGMTPYLMFDGTAAEAMTYEAIAPDSEVSVPLAEAPWDPNSIFGRLKGKYGWSGCSRRSHRAA